MPLSVRRSYMNKTLLPQIKLIISMLIFGSIGIFRNYIPLPSSVIAFVRGFIGMLFLLAVMLLKRDKINFSAIKKAIIPLCLSGAALGINWLLLFEAYRYTSVSTATLCYYMAPTFVIVLSPFIFKEKMTALKAISAGVSLIGMIIISGIFSSGNANGVGILLGLGAAALYATVIILNKFIKDVSDYEKTFVQLGMSAAIMLPYIIATEDIGTLFISSITPSVIILLLIAGIVHTGIAYTLYFGSIKSLPAHTSAVFSYIDPLCALLLSVLILDEKFTISILAGGILILGAAFISEIPKRNSKNK